MNNQVIPNQPMPQQNMPGQTKMPQQPVNQTQMAQPNMAPNQIPMGPTPTQMPPQPVIQPNMVPNQPPMGPTPTQIPPQPVIQTQMAQPNQVPMGPIPAQIPQQPIPPTVQTTIGPQFAAPVAPIAEPVQQAVNLEQEQTPTQDLQSSVVEENLAPSNTEQFSSNNNDSITIDYNALYGVNNEIKEEEKVEEIEDPVFTAQEIVIDTPSLMDRKKDDVVPEFNLNALEGNIQDSENKLTDNVLTDKQQDRADTRRKIIYITVLFLLIVVFIIWIFPIMAGYKY